MDVVITTICSTFTGTANPALASAFESILAMGSSLSSTLEQASAGVSLYPLIILQYDIALRGYVIPFYNAASINNADVDNVVALNAQLVQVLESLAVAGTSGATMIFPSSFGSALYDFVAITNWANIAINKKLAMISCDKQNSINSVNSAVSSELSIVQKQAWISNYFAQRVGTMSISSVSCSSNCVTSTVEATTATTESTSEATTSEATTATSETTSAAADTTSTDTTSTDTTSTDTTSTDTTNTGTADLVTSSRIVSGSVQRCLVRPTDTTTVTAEITYNTAP